MAPQMAFVGMGPMGQAMAKRLVEHGNLEKSLLLFNRTHEVALNHAQAIGGATAVASLSQLVAQSDIIWSCLADDAAVQETFATILAEPVEGKLFVECSTILAETIDELNTNIERAGAKFVAMPVFGEPATAAAGQLVVVPAGPASAIDSIRPYLTGVTASAIVDFPDKAPTKASLLKLIGNVLILTTMEQVAELLVFAEKIQLGTDGVQKLLGALYPGGPRQHIKYASLMVSGEYHRRKAIVGTDSAIALSEKILSLAGSHEVQLKGYEVAIEHLKQARDTAGPDSDILGIYGAVRQEGKLKFKTE